MTYEYDEELPFVLEDEDEWVAGRFRIAYNAEQLLRLWEGRGRIIDTTPRPKIPDNASFITWKTDEYVRVAYKEFDYWVFDGAEVSIPELEDLIGDSDVTVLTPAADIS